MLPSELHRIQSELIPLLDLNKDGEAFQHKSQAFLDKRLAELHDTTVRPPDGTIDASKGNFRGFIMPDTEIFPFAIGKGYRLDDDKIYAEVLPHLHRFYHHIVGSGEPDLDLEVAYFQAALYAAQYTQQSYFGSVHNKPGAFDKRDFLLLDLPEDEENQARASRSISEFKGVAMCTERAAVANNVLRVLGMKPVLELGELKIEEGPSEPHSYLLVRDPKGRELIFDPTNPILVFDENGALTQTTPALYSAEDSLKERVSKTSIVGVHRTLKTTPSGVEQQKKEKYQFTLCPDMLGEELRPE